MSKKVYIDPAKKLGWASLENGTIEYGVLDLKVRRIMETYLSSTCRKTMPNNNPSQEIFNFIVFDYEWNEDKDKFCLIKEKKVIHQRTIQEQLIFLQDWIEYKHAFWTTEFIIEGYAIPSKKQIGAFHEQSKVYAMFDYEVGKYKTIQPTEWFNWVIDEVDEKFVIWNGSKRIKKVDTKKTSKAIASFLMQKEIKDDNEADAICMMFYDNQELFYKYKAEAERIKLSIPRLGIQEV